MALACCYSEGGHAHLLLLAAVLTRPLQAALLLLLVAGLVPWPGRASTFHQHRSARHVSHQCAARRCQTMLAQDLDAASCGRRLSLAQQAVAREPISLSDLGDRPLLKPDQVSPGT